VDGIGHLHHILHKEPKPEPDQQVHHHHHHHWSAESEAKPKPKPDLAHKPLPDPEKEDDSWGDVRNGKGNWKPSNDWDKNIEKDDGQMSGNDMI
jgi:hypothetical protein